MILSRTVNIFLVATPLQYLASEAIVKYFEMGERNYLFYMRENIKPAVNLDLWSNVDYLPWPKKDPKKGLFGKARRIQENIERVAALSNDAVEIRLHMWSLRTEATNYHINFTRSRFPQAAVSVRIIPDGTLGLFLRPMRWFELVGLWVRKARRIFFPSLNVYLYRGDKLGFEASIIDRIYVLKGIPSAFNKNKIITLPNLVEVKIHKKSKEKRALVLSQPFYQMGKCSEWEIEKISKGIRTYLKEQGIEDIEYKQHPYDEIKELFHTDYRELHISIPLEMYLADHFYDVIVGVDSTTLFLAKVMYGKRIRVVSIGLDVVYDSSKNLSARKARKRRLAREVMKKQLAVAGVELVCCSDDGLRQL